MNLAIVATVFAVIFTAELPDKTAVASVVLGSRYRPLYVFAGAAAGFAVQVGLAIAAGSLLALLPRHPIEIAVAILFAIGAVVLLRSRHGDEAGADEHVEPGGRQRSFWKAAWTSFGVVVVAEFGDLTQIATASLAARYHDPLSVGVGAVLALWAVAGIAIIGGRSLLKIMPLAWITRAAAAIMLVLAGVSLAAAVA
ncbi:MAG TPA: TMEM165/GDT1 family protein [Streptosporangiaceae bacterium]|jgi:putative Ca2+/H+ antiporter (TMEM165/GDT1 family)